MSETAMEASKDPGAQQSTSAVSHMHQPPGNLKLLIETDEWEAEQIIRCDERAARDAQQNSDVGFLHIGFSGVFLEQFTDPEIIDRYQRITDVPIMLGLHAVTGWGRKALDEARRWILEGETSCFLFWGDAWIPDLYKRAQAAEKSLDVAELELCA